MTKFAPIVLFVYNRPEHTHNCLESLANNKLAEKSTLYIFADGPKANATTEELQLVQSVRDLIRKRLWCGKVIIRESEINVGLAQSIIKGVTEVIDEHNKIIVLEDDLLTAPLFLTFMNDALNYYASNTDVAGISGFSFLKDFKGNLETTFFLPIASSWGWATWKRQWQITSFDAKSLLTKIENENRTSEFEFGTFPYMKILKQQVEGTISSWAIRFYASFFLQRKWFVFPPVSLVQNTGFGGGATHTRFKDEFMSTVFANGSVPSFSEVIGDERTRHVKATFEKQYGQQHNNTFYSTLIKIKKKLRSLLATVL